MPRISVILLLASCVLPQGADAPQDAAAPRPKPELKPAGKPAPNVDVGAILRKSKPFAEQCKKLKISFVDGEVRVEGEIAYRGGGPCEYLVAIYPAKSHETVVLLDDGPWEGEGRRGRESLKGYAKVLNNAFLAAGFKRGKPFSWDDETGEVFPPAGESLHIYVEWEHVEEPIEDEKDSAEGSEDSGDSEASEDSGDSGDAKTPQKPKVEKKPKTAGNAAKPEHRRALLSDWLWNYKTVHVMEPNFVYTGSLLIEHDGKTFLGAELDGLILAVLNTATALLDSLEDGSLDNGAYEAIPTRIPRTGTRVRLVFSRKKLSDVVTFKPLKLNAELTKSRAEYLKKKKADDAARAVGKLSTSQEGRGQTRDRPKNESESEKPSK